jgi:hypothetical protein
MNIVPRTSEFHWAFCIPHACSPLELELSLTKALEEAFNGTAIGFEVQVKDNQCHVNDPNWMKNLEFLTVFVS